MQKLNIETRRSLNKVGKATVLADTLQLSSGKIKFPIKYSVAGLLSEESSHRDF